MKRFAIACSAFFFLSFQATAQTYFHCDFEEGIPDDFTLIDADGHVPSDDAVSLGFAVGRPWVALTPTGESSQVACATSWYATNATSSDWLITPPFTVTDDNAVLTWRSRSSHKRIHNALSVLVSTSAGTVIEAFDSNNPLYSNNDESNAWTTHQVSLQSYKGQTITIAFVENSTNGSYLYLDDISANVYSPLQISSTMKGRTALAGSVPLLGIVTNVSSENIDSYTITATADDGATHSVTVNETLAPDEQRPFSLDHVFSLGKHTTQSFNACVTTGDYSHQITGTVTSYQRKVVAEELTGTWCAWCVRGIVNLELLNTRDSDKFIGYCVHNSDVMENDLNNQIMRNFSISGLPNGVVARTFTAQPEYFETGYKSYFATETVFVSIEPEATTNFDNGDITVSTILTFADDAADSDYRVSYVIVENNVHHPNDSEYYQNNNIYSGGNQGEMGGWEKLPATISPQDMWFHDVARYFDGDFNGISGQIPTEIKAGEPVNVNHSLTVPLSAVDNLHNCDLVILLIDGSDNRIVNAERVALDKNAEEKVDVVRRWLEINQPDITGDINNDKIVDSSDVAQLVGIINGTQSMQSNADVNNDGITDASDITKLITIILGN